MKETEKVFRLMQSYMEANQLEMTQENMDKFVKLYNSKQLGNEYKTNEDRSYEFYEEALEEKDETRQVELLERALEIYPHNYDAFIALIAIKNTSAKKRLKKLNEKILEADKEMEERGFMEDIGNFYKMQGTRPYMRLYYAKLQLELSDEQYNNAVATAERILLLNKNDNLGVRYTLSGLYLYFRAFDSFESLWKKYPSAHDACRAADFALEAAYQGNESLYRRRLNKLKDLNIFLYVFLAAKDFDCFSIQPADYYSPGSIQEADVYYDDHEFLFDDAGLEKIPGIPGVSFASVLPEKEMSAVTILFIAEYLYNRRKTEFTEKALFATKPKDINIPSEDFHNKLLLLQESGILQYEPKSKKWKFTTKGEGIMAVLANKIEEALCEADDFLDEEEPE